MTHVALMKNRDQQLRLFLEIAQCKSPTRAADVLGLTQSGLSKQRSSLEAFLGQPLFERHGRGVELTDAGRRLQDVARPAYELVDNAILQLREQQGLTEGSLCVATIHTLSLVIICALVRKEKSAFSWQARWLISESNEKQRCRSRCSCPLSPRTIRSSEGTI